MHEGEAEGGDEDEEEVGGAAVKGFTDVAPA